MDLFKSVLDICDTVSLIIYCKFDKTFLLINEDDNELWIPTSKVVKGYWKDTAVKLATEFFDAHLTFDVLRIYKVWVPNHNPQSVYHVIYNICITPEIKKQMKILGKFRGKFRWVKEAALDRYLKNELLRSPEVYYLMKLGSSETAIVNHPEGNDQKLLSNLSEHSEIVIEIMESNVILNPGNHTPMAEMVESAGYTRDDQYLFYREFLLMVFPAFFMHRTVFTKFLKGCNWNVRNVNRVFDVADVYGRGALSYLDFLHIMAATDPKTKHGGLSAELRCRYIFRYYDRNSNRLLDASEFREMVESIRRTKNLSTDVSSVNRELHTYYKSLGIAPGNTINQSQFLQAVGDLKLRGTSVLLRCPLSYASVVKKMQIRETKARYNVQTEETSEDSAKIVDLQLKKLLKDITPKPSYMANIEINGRRQVAIHTIKLMKNGTILDVEDIRLMKTSISPSSIETFDVSPRILKMSTDAFDLTTAPNELITGLRYFVAYIRSSNASGRRRSTKSAFSWGSVDPRGFANCLIEVCQIVTTYFRQEPRLLNVPSPVFVMGDLHGNLPDLLSFERVLWHLGPGLSPNTLLFLGDYVDRGPHGIEIIAYLFAYKSQYPSKVCLIRGNHEIRDVQKMFTFLKECIIKFGDITGMAVWTAVNNAFDTMPIAALIDHKIFCCHGGIPPPWLAPVIGAINDIPTPLPNPDEQSQLAWEIMWNDPVRVKTLTESVMAELIAGDGFAANTRRGTAHMFNQQALNRFLQVNHLSHVIRAHEVQQKGIQVQFGGKLISVFTSSHYCGGKNEAACVLVNRNLRIFRVDTR